MNKQPKVTEKTKKKFIQAFCQLYTINPIDKITINKVTQLAGYNRSTFYLYFSDIYALRTSIEDEIIQYVQTHLSLEENEIATQHEVLQKILFLFKSKEMELSAVLGDYGSFNFLKRLKKEVSANPKIATKLVPGISSENKYFSYLLEGHLSLAISLFQLWLKQDKDLSMDELVKLTYHLYNDGINQFEDWI